MLCIFKHNYSLCGLLINRLGINDNWGDAMDVTQTNEWMLKSDLKYMLNKTLSNNVVIEQGGSTFIFTVTFDRSLGDLELLQVDGKNAVLYKKHRNLYNSTDIGCIIFMIYYTTTSF